MDATEFLSLVFDDAPSPERRIAIFTTPEKAAVFFEDSASAAGYAGGKADSQDVYFGLGLVGPNVRKGRGKAADVACIGCVWADVDVAGPGHRKANLPPDESAARRIIEKVGPAPSVLVHTGHGLQAYWLLTEPWMFDTDAERARAAELCRRWSATVRAVAALDGFDADAVGDLARVFRLPGTVNRKGEPVPVRVIDAQPQRRYDADDLEVYLVAEEFEPDSPAPTVQVGPVVLRPDAEPPGAKLMALIENDARFKRTWRRTRTDLHDQSPSAYDMSLAAIAASAGWGDQEIADLLIAARRHHGDDVGKALRRDYVQRTIGKARAALGRDAALLELAEEADAGPGATENGRSPPDQRERLLGRLSTALGVKITRWLQHGREDAQYSLVLADGRDVLIGSAANVFDPRRFRDRLYEATGVTFSPPKGKGSARAWEAVCRALARVVEVVENQESFRITRWGNWVRQYLSQVQVHAGEEWHAAFHYGEPFEHDGLIGLSAESLRKWLRTELDERLTLRVLWDGLRLLGFRAKTMFTRVNGKATTRSYWVQDSDRVFGEGALTKEGKTQTKKMKKPTK